MPSREKRMRRRRRGFPVLPVLIGVLSVVAAILLVILINTQPEPSLDGEKVPIVYPENPEFVDPKDAAASALVLTSATVGPTPSPTPDPAQASPAPEATQTAAAEPQGLAPTAAPFDYMLPIYNRANRGKSDEMMIAITVDDCDKPAYMARIVQIAENYDAKLTLFPTGDAVMTKGMTESFRTCVKSLGYEIENHGYARKLDYTLTDGELALSIWKQGIAVSYALGRDYQQHFYRPRRIGSDSDQRTHFLVGKLGMLGIGSYTVSYKDQTIDSLVETLANGNIYQFDMSDESCALFESFLKAASRKGYKLVTLNTLFGLEANAVSESLTIDQQELPTFEGYQESYYDLKLNDRTHAIVALQQRLIDLGYLKPAKGEKEVVADGFYGPATSTAVSVFQAKVGITATGNANVQTQEALFAADAPAA